MTRELKANLIFLVVLILLISPGFVILMRKRLNGPSKPIFMGDAVVSSAAYNQPLPIPPGLPRVEPASVRAWVTQLLQQDAGDNVELIRDGHAIDARPIMGDRFTTQLLAMPSTKDASLRLLVWQESTVPPQIAPASASAVRVEATRSVAVPKDIRHALQEVGYIDPPDAITLVRCRLLNESTQQLQIELARGKIEVLALPSTHP